MKKRVAFFILFFVFFQNLYAIVVPEWNIPYINQDIKVDGVLNESAYKKAFKYTNFFQTDPGYNITPSQKTELYIFVNNKGLVLGLKCYDSTGNIPKTMYKRDEIITKDNVVIGVDTSGKAKNFYVIGISPTNCIMDAFYDKPSENMNFGFDFSFLHATKIKKNSFCVEVLIPFSSINFPLNRKQKWLLSVQRTISKKIYETDTLGKSYRNSDDPRQGMVYINFELPEKIENKRKKLKLIPSLVVSHLKHDEEFFGSTDNYNSDKGDLGLTVEYSPSTNTVFKGTIHPDFSQVEADDTYQRVNNRYPVYLREKRPFFMDGMESFSTPFELLYTRRIVKPEYGLKFSTKLKNKYGIYLISAMEKDVPSERFGYSDEFKKDVYWNVVRTTYNLDNRGSFLGFMAIERNYGSDFNRVLSTDGVVKKGNLTLKYQGVITTLSEKSGNKTGNALYIQTSYLFNKYFDGGLSYKGLSPNFNDDLGFFQRVNYRSYDVWLGFSYLPEKKVGLIQSIYTNLDFWNDYNYQSEMTDQAFNFSNSITFKHQVSFSISYYTNNEEYKGRVYPVYSWSFNLSYDEHRVFQPSFYYSKGRGILYGDNPSLVNNKIFYFGFTSDISFMTISTGISLYNYSDRVTDETIRRQKSIEVVGTYFFNDHTNFKVFYISDLADMRDYNYNQPYHYINLLFTWRKNAFTKLYIGYNNGHSTYRMTDKTMWGFERDKYFYAKITYLF